MNEMMRVMDKNKFFMQRTLDEGLFIKNKAAY